MFWRTWLSPTFRANAKEPPSYNSLTWRNGETYALISMYVASRETQDFKSFRSSFPNITLKAGSGMYEWNNKKILITVISSTLNSLMAWYFHSILSGPSIQHNFKRRKQFQMPHIAAVTNLTKLFSNITQKYNYLSTCYRHKCWKNGIYTEETILCHSVCED